MKLRRGKASPKKEAADFTATGKDKDGFDVKYISSDKGRGVFSCVHFNKRDFLLEYRGQLINKLECDHRQKVYHDALKVFMSEFRFNGKLLWYVWIGLRCRVCSCFWYKSYFAKIGKNESELLSW
ncbi:hypothetical protein QTP70_021424, partial [Hemibagrus guttatus]